MMSLYEAMFTQYGVKVAQILITKPDFYNTETRHNLNSTINELIALNILPIINTNDAVTPPPQVCVRVPVCVCVCVLLCVCVPVYLCVCVCVSSDP